MKVKCSKTDSWTKVPFQGMTIFGFKSVKKAFQHGIKEYLPFGYNYFIYSTDVDMLFIGKI